MWKVIKTIFEIPLLLVVLALMFGFFFGTPISLFLETRDLLRMRGETFGTIRRTAVHDGSEGTSVPTRQIHWYLLAFLGLLVVNLIRAYRVRSAGDLPAQDVASPADQSQPHPAIP